MLTAVDNTARRRYLLKAGNQKWKNRWFPPSIKPSYVKFLKIIIGVLDTFCESYYTATIVYFFSELNSCLMQTMKAVKRIRLKVIFLSTQSLLYSSFCSQAFCSQAFYSRHWSKCWLMVSLTLPIKHFINNMFWQNIYCAFIAG